MSAFKAGDRVILPSIEWCGEVLSVYPDGTADVSWDRDPKDGVGKKIDDHGNDGYVRDRRIKARPTGHRIVQRILRHECAIQALADVSEQGVTDVG